MVKVTFTLDEATIDRLRRTAARVRKPQSQVVREAFKDYAERVGKLSEEERTRLLKLFDTVVPAIPLRPVARVDAELRAILAAELYRVIRRPRGREIDLAIAACALVHGAPFWTLNPHDFRDIPGLTIVSD